MYVTLNEIYIAQKTLERRDGGTAEGLKEKVCVSERGRVKRLRRVKNKGVRILITFFFLLYIHFLSYYYTLPSIRIHTLSVCMSVCPSSSVCVPTTLSHLNGCQVGCVYRNFIYARGHRVQFVASARHRRIVTRVPSRRVHDPPGTGIRDA